MKYIQSIIPPDLIPPWAQFLISMTWYAFSLVATTHFTAMIPSFLKWDDMREYFDPIAKWAYTGGKWLALVCGVLQAIKGLVYGMYLLIWLLAAIVL